MEDKNNTTPNLNTKFSINDDSTPTINRLDEVEKKVDKVEGDLRDVQERTDTIDIRTTETEKNISGQIDSIKSIITNIREEIETSSFMQKNPRGYSVDLYIRQSWVWCSLTTVIDFVYCFAGGNKVFKTAINNVYHKVPKLAVLQEIEIDKNTSIIHLAFMEDSCFDFSHVKHRYLRLNKNDARNPVVDLGDPIDKLLSHEALLGAMGCPLPKKYVKKLLYRPPVTRNYKGVLVNLKEYAKRSDYGPYPKYESLR